MMLKEYREYWIDDNWEARPEQKNPNDAHVIGYVAYEELLELLAEANKTLKFFKAKQYHPRGGTPSTTASEDK